MNKLLMSNAAWSRHPGENQRSHADRAIGCHDCDAQMIDCEKVFLQNIYCQDEYFVIICRENQENYDNLSYLYM